MRPVIDHVPFGWSELDDAIARFERLGLPPTPGGVHGDAATEMATVAFPDGSYLELVAPVDDRPEPDSAVRPARPPAFLAADAGPCAWCVETASVHSECKRVVDQDIPVYGPVHATRERPDGTLVEWDVAFLGAPAERRKFPFALADRTPRSYRIEPNDDLLGGPLSGVGAVVVAVADLDAAVERFGDLYRFPAARRDVDPAFGADLAAFPGQDVLLAEPHEDTWLADRLDALGEGPCTALLDADVDRARHQYPLGGGREWFGRRVAFVDDDAFGYGLGVIERA